MPNRGDKINWKRLLVTVLKYAVSIGFLVWLFSQKNNRQAFAELAGQSPNWWLLSVGILFAGIAVMTTFVRWHMLVRTLEIPFTLASAIRIGFLGFMFNFVSLGAVGGDLFKAFFVAREQKKRKTEAVATLFVDRLMGLVGLMITAAIGSTVVGLQTHPDQKMRLIFYCSWGGTVVSLLGFAMVLLPGFTTGPISEFLMGLPRVGGLFRRLIEAVRMYRRRPRVLFAGLAMSVLVHFLFPTCMLFIILGLPAEGPPIYTHYVVVPISLLASVLPLPGGGLGVLEFAIAELYKTIGGYNEGLVAAFIYRAITILLALIGLVYYLTHRGEVSEVLEEAAEEEEHEGSVLPINTAVANGETP